MSLVNGNYEVPVSEFSEQKYLCTCGLSSIKPYCDGSHNKEGTNKPLRIKINGDKVEFRAIREIQLEQIKQQKEEEAKKPREYKHIIGFGLLTLAVLTVKQVLNK
ncbi:hypothetical protein ABK040_001123 [Willaertia magna]